MQSKIITYKRTLNLRNYENKQLEESAEVLEGEDPEEAISRLINRNCRDRDGVPTRLFAIVT